MHAIIATKKCLGLTVGREYAVIAHYPATMRFGEEVMIQDDDGWSHNLSREFWKPAPAPRGEG